MFSKVVFFVAAMAAFVAATPIPGTSGQCNTGPVQCCNSVYQSQSAESALIASIVGLNLQGITGSIGTQCSPISAVGVGSNQCSQQPVCCENNNYNGLIVVGCSPVNL